MSSQLGSVWKEDALLGYRVCVYHTRGRDLDVTSNVFRLSFLQVVLLIEFSSHLGTDS